MIPDRIFVPYFKVEKNQWYGITKDLAADQHGLTRTFKMYLYPFSDNRMIEPTIEMLVDTDFSYDDAEIEAILTETAVGSEKGNTFFYAIDVKCKGWGGSDPFKEITVSNIIRPMISIEMAEYWMAALINIKLRETYMGAIRDKNVPRGSYNRKSAYESIRINVTGDTRVEVLSTQNERNKVIRNRMSLFKIVNNPKNSVVGFSHVSDFENINFKIRSLAISLGKDIKPSIIHYRSGSPDKNITNEYEYNEVLVAYNEYDEYHIESIVKDVMLLVAEDNAEEYKIFENVMTILQKSILSKIKFYSRLDSVDFIEKIATFLLYMDANSFYSLIENNNHYSREIQYDKEQLHKKFSDIITIIYEYLAESGQIQDFEPDTFHAPKYK
ncbi:hypothetical protein [Exiguobacterium sp. s191]|uniref:hypothetical protein n=1 Tax=Exiguobacterium sp. s191 TaxID=2751196 RepID=UPI001BE8B382|nr:hypothetical protein [Exiguobacterium sp. s191]